MKMADGGFRPAYNVQLATDAGTGCIVGVDVTNNGTDQPHVVPMLDDIAARTGRTPDEYLVDGGFVTHENIEAVTARGATIYAPPAKSRNPEIDRAHQRRPQGAPQAGPVERHRTHQGEVGRAAGGVDLQRAEDDLSRGGCIGGPRGPGRASGAWPRKAPTAT